MVEHAACAPGTRVEVREGSAPTPSRSGVVLYVGSDTNVLVAWDDQSTSVIAREALAPTHASSASAATEH